jgi:hypothetical protein
MLLFPLQHHHDSHYTQHDLFQPRVLAQQNGNVSDKGDESDNAADDVFFAVEERLAGRVEFGIVCDIVVTFCEEAEGGFADNPLACALDPQASFLRPLEIHSLVLVPSNFRNTAPKQDKLNRLTLRHTA